MKTDEELKKEYPELYRIAREGKTEAPFTGKHFDANGGDMFHCAVCGAELFKADTKFESGSGWPSFTDPANTDAVTLHEDGSIGMSRTEVRCKSCGAHLGHVFPDGPVVDGKVCDRFCINSISLDLKDGK